MGFPKQSRKTTYCWETRRSKSQKPSSNYRQNVSKIARVVRVNAQRSARAFSMQLMCRAEDRKDRQQNGERCEAGHDSFHCVRVPFGWLALTAIAADPCENRASGQMSLGFKEFIRFG